MHSLANNDNFKIYIAETKKVGSKFTIAEHGGGAVSGKKREVRHGPLYGAGEAINNCIEKFHVVLFLDDIVELLSFLILQKKKFQKQLNILLR